MVLTLKAVVRSRKPKAKGLVCMVHLALVYVWTAHQRSLQCDNFIYKHPKSNWLPLPLPHVPFLVRSLVLPFHNKIIGKIWLNKNFGIKALNINWYYCRNELWNYFGVQFDSSIGEKGFFTITTARHKYHFSEIKLITYWRVYFLCIRY